MELEKHTLLEQDGWKVLEIRKVIESELPKYRTEMAFLQIVIPDRDFIGIPINWHKVVIVDYQTSDWPRIHEHTIGVLVNSDYCPQAVKNLIYLYTL